MAAVALVTVAAALAGCEDRAATPDAPAAPAPPRPPAPSDSSAAFVHAVEDDVSGYYLPTSDVQVGNYRLDHVFLGQGTEFGAWTGGERSDTFAPVMLQFDDVSSPMVRSEIGEAHSVTVRVLPIAYAVTDDRVRFAGQSDELGSVSADLRLDLAALATARRNLGSDAVVLTGAIQIGTRRFDDVPMRWWMGD
jgi:hypothetical protein